MKTFIKFSVITLLTLGMIPPVSLAQAQKTGSDQDEVLARAIRQKVRAGQMTGMEVLLYEVTADNRAIPVLDTSRVFKSTDSLRLEFKSSLDGYVYLVNVSRDGKKAVIFPDARFKNYNKVEKGKTYRLPEEEVMGLVDDEESEVSEGGDEIIQVIMSRQQIPFFERAIKESKGELGKDSAAAASELFSMAAKSKSGIQAEPIAKVLPPNDKGEVLPREIRLKVFTPKDKEEQGTVIAMTDGLKDGDVAIFEIRLRYKK